MRWFRLLMGACATTAVVAYAQPPASSAPSGAGKKLQYQSAFDGYRPFTDSGTVPWRRANDELGAAGAHAGHVMQRDTPSAKSAPSAAPPAKDAPSVPEHPGHKR
jgi:hypothetical protein